MLLKRCPGVRIMINIYLITFIKINLYLFATLQLQSLHGPHKSKPGLENKLTYFICSLVPKFATL